MQAGMPEGKNDPDNPKDAFRPEMPPTPSSALDPGPLPLGLYPERRQGPTEKTPKGIPSSVHQSGVYFI